MFTVLGGPQPSKRVAEDFEISGDSLLCICIDDVHFVIRSHKRLKTKCLESNTNAETIYCCYKTSVNYPICLGLHSQKSGSVLNYCWILAYKRCYTITYSIDRLIIHSNIFQSSVLLTFLFHTWQTTMLSEKFNLQHSCATL